MGKYVDGYLLAVPKDRIEEYRKLAQQSGEIWKKYGALDYVECVAEDVKSGEVTSFPQAVKLEDNEVVVFSWIVYESREKRDEVNEKVMQDPFMQDFNMETCPFDGKRMMWGGFEKIVDL